MSVSCWETWQKLEKLFDPTGSLENNASTRPPTLSSPLCDRNLWPLHLSWIVLETFQIKSNLFVDIKVIRIFQTGHQVRNPAVTGAPNKRIFVMYFVLVWPLNLTSWLAKLRCRSFPQRSFHAVAPRITCQFASETVHLFSESLFTSLVANERTGTKHYASSQSSLA